MNIKIGFISSQNINKYKAKQYMLNNILGFMANSVNDVDDIDKLKQYILDGDIIMRNGIVLFRHKMTYTFLYLDETTKKQFLDNIRN